MEDDSGKNTGNITWGSGGVFDFCHEDYSFDITHYQSSCNSQVYI